MTSSKTRISQNIRALILIACLACAAHSPIPAYGAEPIKIGILAFPSKPLALAKWQPLTVVLKQHMPERDFAVLALTPPELDEAVSAGQLDFVLTNSGHYVLLRNRNALSAPLASLATDGAGQSLTVYGGVIFSRAAQADINTLRDIKGKTVAAVDSKSLGGFQMQAYELSRVGVHLPQEIKLIATGLPQGQVVTAVLAGRADVGFVRSGVLETMVRQGKLDSKQLKILNRQVLPDFPLLVSTRLYPEWAFAALPQVDEKLARQVVVALFELEENSAVTRAMGIHGFVVPADYTPVEEVLRELRLPPFDAAPRFTLQDVWSRYQWQTTGVLLAGGVILLLGVSVLLMYRKLAANHQVVLRQKQKLQESEEKFHATAQALEETNLRLRKELAEREAAEQELQAANEQLSVLLDSLPVAVYRSKSEGDYAVLYMSQNVASFTGYAAKDFMEQSDLWFSHIHPDDAPRISAEMVLLPEKDRHVYEYRWLNADGTYLWIRDYVQLIRSEDGTPRYLVGMWQNITEDKLAAEALEEAELRFKAVFNAAMDGILVADTQTKTIIMGNSAGCDMLGYQLEELIRLGIEEIHPAEKLPEVLPQFERQAKGEIRIASDMPMQRQDGSVFYADISSSSMVLEGRPVMVGVFHDVTERKQGEEKIHRLNDELEEKVQMRTQQLRDAQKKLEAHVAEIKQAHDALSQALEYANTLLRSSPDGVIAVDLDLRITEWNLCMEQMCGKSREQALGLDLGELPFMKATGEAARIREGLEGQNIGPREVAYRLPGTDSESFFESIMAPLRGPAGQILGAVLRVRDITERKRAEQAVSESEAQLRSVFDAVQDGIVLVDAQTRHFLMANASMCRMLGYNLEEFLNLEVKDLHPAAEMPRIAREFEQKIKEGGGPSQNIQMKKKDGTVFYADVNTGQMIIKEAAGLVSVFRDITERKQAEEEIRQLNNSLNEKIQQLLATQEELVRKEKLALLGQVVGSVGHELRNPLGVMNNAVYFLQTVLADADETTREYLQIITTEIANADRIVSELLDSVRTKLPQSAAVSVGELIDRTLRSLTMPAAITVALDLPESLPPVWVDAGQIQQVFRNLIGNGVEAMPEGGTLAIKAVENSQESTVTVSVRDTGCGMSQEVLVKLFQPLFTTKARGIGLGLVVVNNLIHVNGGNIEVQSEPGQGTTFTVVLPTGNASIKES